MAAVAHQPTIAARSAPVHVPNDSRSSSNSRPTSFADSSSMTSTQSVAPTATAPKKPKGKKNADPPDARQQIAARLAQLEQDAAGERDQDQEIEREVKKRNREMTKMLNTLHNDGEKIDALQKRNMELLSEMKRIERDRNTAKKKADQMQKERDSKGVDLTKANQAKDKLEKLSRDLTRDNKKLKDEVQRLEDSEGRTRQDLNEKIEDLTLQVEGLIDAQENPDSQPANLQSDELFRQKFKSFIEQYEMRELHFTCLLRTKELELQYQMARLEQQRKAQEVESSKSHQLTRQVSTFSQTETELRNQLNIYVEKFKQVEDTLNNSNDLFLTFRKEMEDMSKKTKRLEKENLNLTRKQEATNRNIIEMAEERAKTQREMEQLRKKNERLERLCRGMQEQGRGQAMARDSEVDEEATDSEYEYEDEDEEMSGEGEYDEDTEEETIDGKPKFGPVPPPPPPPQPLPNGKPAGGSRAVNGVNGVKR